MAAAPAPVIEISSDWVTQEIQKSNPQAEAAEDVKQRALAVRVTDDVTLQEAASFAQKIKAKSKEIADYWKPIKDSAFKAHRAITARESELLKPLADGEAHLKREITAYHAEQQRIAREAQRQAEEAARRAAEEERERAIEQAEAEGASKVEAAAMVSAPLIVHAPAAVVIPAAQPKGVSFSKIWKARVANFGQLIAYVASNPGQQNLLEPNESALDAMAKALKSAGSIPGVEFYEETVPSIRA